MRSRIASLESRLSAPVCPAAMAFATAAAAASATAPSRVPVQASLQWGPKGAFERAFSSEMPQFSGNSLTASKVLSQRVSGKRDAVVVGRRLFASRLLVVAAGGGEVEKKPWDFGRFVQTWQFFNEPFNFGKFVEGIISKFSPPTESKAKGKDVVLVTGATGGVGKRVVEVLRAKGIRVRALVRNLEKAKSLLGPDVDLVLGDVTQKSTLLPEFFKDVVAVINSVSVTVGPKEGDTPERKKYYQGIKFFDPEIKGDSPETVEFKGITNLLDAVKDRLGVRDGVTLFAIGADGPQGAAWGALDDVVMGGASESSLQMSASGGEDGGPVALFKGNASTANRGGFASIRTKNFSPCLDLSPYEGLALRVRGNGKRFKLILRTTADWDAIGYTASFDTAAGQWQTIQVPFKSLIPIFRAKTVKDAARFDPSTVFSLQLLYSKFESDGMLNPTFETGPFELPIASVTSYLREPVTPRFVHVSSAGVTRPDRPGLDLSNQPPAVRLNKELDYILTYKLKGEDAVRESGVPFTVVRPCALTEEPAGAELIFEQGDNIMGKVAREEVARILVAALQSPASTDTTFEVKSTVPFSQPFTIDEANRPAERDYETFFRSLRTGVTGKSAQTAEPAVARR